MSATYESLSPNGHSTMITRIFQKLKTLIDGKQNVLTAGQFIDITNDVISSDQADMMTYTQYQQLSQAEKLDGTIRCITDYPEEKNFTYDETQKAIIIKEGAAVYDASTKAIILL